MAERIFLLASSLMASGNNIRPQVAITIAVKFIELIEKIEHYKHEAQTDHGC